MWTVLETAMCLWLGLFPEMALWGSFLAYALPLLGLANLAFAATQVERWTLAKRELNAPKPEASLALGERASLSGRGVGERLP